MHSLLCITHQVTSRRKLYFNFIYQRTTVFFPSRMENLFLIQRILTTKHLQHITQMKKKKIVQNKHRRMQSEGVKKTPPPCTRKKTQQTKQNPDKQRWEKVAPSYQNIHAKGAPTANFIQCSLMFWYSTFLLSHPHLASH